MNLVQFISAFGLGAVVSAFTQAWLATRAEWSKRSFQEKKECYAGYLDALHQSEVERTETASLNVGHWRNRIELVGSEDVIRWCAQIQETNPTAEGMHPARPGVLVALKHSMRQDLGFAK